MEDRAFDPSQSQEAKWVGKLISAYPNEKNFVADRPYRVNDNGTIIDLTPTYSIVRALPLINNIDKDTWKYDKYFIIAQSIEGKGAFGEVRPTVGRWKIDVSGLNYKPNSKRVIKSCFTNQSFSFSSSHSESEILPLSEGSMKTMSQGEVANEFELLSQVPYFGIKYRMINRNNASITIMSKVGFTGLKQFIKDWHNNPKIMNTNQALALAISLIDEMNEFNEQYNLIHGDVKPANTRLEMVKGQLKPKLIDLGLSFKRSKPEYGVRGHYGYIDPHNLKHEDEAVDVLSDQYSMMITIMELFGFNAKSIPNYFSFTNSYPEMDYSTLFLSHTDLDEDHKNLLISSIIDATEEFRCDRTSIKSVRDCLQTVLVQRLRETKVNDFNLRIYLYKMSHRLDSIYGLDKSLEEEVYSDYQALMTLDELLSDGKLDNILYMPLRNIIKDHLNNGHNCTVIFLFIKEEIVTAIENMVIKEGWTESIIQFLQKTKLLAKEPMMINSSCLIQLAERLSTIRELDNLVTIERQSKEKKLTGLEIPKLSLFSTAGLSDEIIYSDRKDIDKSTVVSL